MWLWTSKRENVKASYRISEKGLMCALKIFWSQNNSQSWGTCLPWLHRGSDLTTHPSPSAQGFSVSFNLKFLASRHDIVQWWCLLVIAGRLPKIAGCQLIKLSTKEPGNIPAVLDRQPSIFRFSCLCVCSVIPLDISKIFFIAFHSRLVVDL